MHSFAKNRPVRKNFPSKQQPHKKRVSAVKEKSIEKHTSILIPISSSLRKIYIYTEKERQSRARLHGRERRNKRVKEALLSLSFVVSGFRIAHGESSELESPNLTQFAQVLLVLYKV